MDTAQDKQQIRVLMRELRNSLSGEKGQRLSLQACHFLIEENIWNAASSVALFVSHNGEIDTGMLLDTAWKQGKQVLLPVCRKEFGTMDFVPCAGKKDLRPGKFGIQEPVPTEENSKAPGICVVPGLAFDSAGNRLGMGGGYYDRFFASPGWENTVRIGICFAAQLLDYVPHTEQDLPVHGIVTEKGIIWPTQQ